jgi:hypothetical protein
MIVSILLASALATLGRAHQEVATEFDELQPCRGEFSTIRSPTEPYYPALARALLEEGGIRECQLVAVPSFDNEWAVYLLREDRESPARLVFKCMREPLYSRLMDALSGLHARHTVDAGMDGARRCVAVRSTWTSSPRRSPTR